MSEQDVLSLIDSVGAIGVLFVVVYSVYKFITQLMPRFLDVWGEFNRVQDKQRESYEDQSRLIKEQTAAIKRDIEATMQVDQKVSDLSDSEQSRHDVVVNHIKELTHLLEEQPNKISEQTKGAIDAMSNKLEEVKQVIDALRASHDAANIRLAGQIESLLKKHDSYNEAFQDAMRALDSKLERLIELQDKNDKT